MKPTLKLLLYRSIFFLVGAVVLVAGGVASQYHPSADYSECDGSNASENLNVSSVYYHYGHSTGSPADLISTFVAFPVVPTSVSYAGLVAPSSLSLHATNVPFSTP